MIISTITPSSVSGLLSGFVVATVAVVIFTISVLLQYCVITDSMEDRVERLSRNDVFYLLCLPFQFLQLGLNKVIIHRNRKFNKQEVQETQKQS